jgi:hypothetical protein
MKHCGRMVARWLSSHPVDQVMPDWILAPVCLVVLFGFIGYALRQGTKVKPDQNNSNFGPSFSGSDGDSGSGDVGGHSI